MVATTCATGKTAVLLEASAKCDASSCQNDLSGDMESDARGADMPEVQTLDPRYGWPGVP